MALTLSIVAGIVVVAHVPSRGRRQAAASRIRRQGRGGRRRDGRRRQQHAAGAGVLRAAPRASPLRHDDRPRNDRAPAQPALSRAAAHPACRGHRRADDRPARLGDHACGKRGAITTGDVVLVCTLGLSVLHATRDLAVALVDVTQHIARLSEALQTLLVPHDLRDDPQAAPLIGLGASVDFRTCVVRLSRRAAGVRRSQPVARAGRSASAWSGIRAAASRRCFALLQRFYDVQQRAHPDRRPGHRARHPGQPARRHRRGAAGRLAVPSLDHGEHPLRPAGRVRRRR